MAGSGLEEALGPDATWERIRASDPYKRYLAAHPDGPSHATSEDSNHHLGTGIFSIMMSAAGAGTTYEWLSNLRSASQYSKTIAAGFAVIDLALLISGLGLGKAIWDYESSENLKRSGRWSDYR